MLSPCFKEKARKMEHWAAIISALGVIITTTLTIWVKATQNRRDKMTDLKIDEMRRAGEEKWRKRNTNSSVVFGELWNVLYALKADRVYVIQPHPLGNEMLLTIQYEVKRKGVEAMKPQVQGLKMSEIACFTSLLGKELYLCYTDIDKQVEDKYAKSLLSSCGTTAVAIKRLSDSRHEWVGSLCAEFTHGTALSCDTARDVLHSCATNIQYILPEVVEVA